MSTREPVTIFSRKRTWTQDAIKRRVRELGWWYQHFELPMGVVTGNGEPPAYLPETRWRLLEPYVPASLQGKTVLDAGGNAGYFSVQMLKRGAKRCVLVEPFVEFSEQARFVAELHDFKIQVINEDVHTFCLTTTERFDYVVFLGLFYHLKYPGIVLDRFAEMTRERMYFHSQVIPQGTDSHPTQPDYRPGEDDAALADPSFPKMAFIERLFNGDPTNWWIPASSALEPLVRSAGMKVIARPHPQLIVAEPDQPLGKVVFNRKLVFPKYGKRGGAVHPGPQRVDPELWRKLLAMRDKSGAG
jgi:tRNA (mo5U34)-methyltransferase